MAFFGLFPDKETDVHSNGSTTDRYPEYNVSITKDSEGNVLEETRQESIFLYGDVTTTYDGDGNIINIQDRK